MSKDAKSGSGWKDLRLVDAGHNAAGCTTAGRVARPLSWFIRRLRSGTVVEVRDACGLGIAELAAMHLVAQSLLRGLGQIAKIRRQFTQFIVALYAILFREPERFTGCIEVHGEQYSSEIAPAQKVG
jgi:hypothetical protein